MIDDPDGHDHPDDCECILFDAIEAVYQEMIYGPATGPCEDCGGEGRRVQLSDSVGTRILCRSCWVKGTGRHPRRG